MNAIVKYRRSFAIVTALVLLVCLLIRCMDNEANNNKTDGRSFASYAGSRKCARCHRDIYEKHLQTAHQLTSQPAGKESIMGSFEKDSNRFWYTPSLLLSMEQRDSGFYQVVYFRNEEKMAIRFDVVIGSGVMGQSYLHRRQDRLYQMPISYFAAANQWSNSPGFPTDKVLTDRPITARCLECHVTFAEGEGGTDMEPLSFPANKMIFGVGCEKCHGPAAMHVEYQTKHPKDTIAKFIINPSSLSRLQQLDICAVCHGGKIQKTKPSFSFTAGQNLTDYFSTNTMDQTAMSSGEVEVHGNQYGLLQASKCFKQSDLTCNSCHNSHENERGKITLYSARCMNCHDVNANNFKTKVHNNLSIIRQNCIDCHMPLQPSRAIAVYLQGKVEPVASLIRSHYIGIYPDVTKKFVDKTDQ
jgi:Cytochrome c554 and c-prime/NapC/NirT cytochrome c family, N-terminal region